jgi:CBS domain-containing protein
VTVSPTTTVREVIQLLATNNIGAVLVVWVDALVGIFSERDALLKIGDRIEEVAHEPIRHFMTPAPETLGCDDTIAYALNRMAVGDFRHIPIEQGEKPVGIISVRDMLRYLTRKFPKILVD